MATSRELMPPREISGGFFYGGMTMQEFLDLASNYAERNDLPLSAYRSETGEWFARIEIKDGLGWFSIHVPLLERNNKESLELFQNRVEQKLTTTLIKERERRIKNYTGRSPAIGKAA